jgi:hypothetical protein
VFGNITEEGVDDESDTTSEWYEFAIW